MLKKIITSEKQYNLKNLDINTLKNITIKAADRPGISKDIFQQITETKIKIREVSIRLKKIGSINIQLIIEMKDENHLKELLNKIKKNVNGVSYIYQKK